MGFDLFVFMLMSKIQTCVCVGGVGVCMVHECFVSVLVSENNPEKTLLLLVDNNNFRKIKSVAIIVLKSKEVTYLEYW